MDRAEALARLPRPYAVGLELDDAGAGPRAIAARLGVELEAVPALLRIGRAKLATLLRDGNG